MSMIKSISSGDRTNIAQKVFAGMLLIGAGYLAVNLLNTVIPPINQLLKNIWTLLLYGVPLTVIAMYVVSNPLFIWGLFKTLSWKLTAWIVKQDPLSVMDRYVDYLTDKLRSLHGTINILRGKKEKLDRNVSELEKKIKENLRLGEAALKRNESQAASTFGVKIQTDKNTMMILKPLQSRVNKSLDFLQALSENWEFGIEKLKYQIHGKRTEYEIIKETHRGLKNAEDFINSDSEAAKLYGYGLKALEESVTQKVGYIEEFHRKSKNIMSAISIEKQAIHDEGLKELEMYMEDGKLTLPDFSKLSDEIQYEMLPVKTTDKSSSFNL